MKKIVVPKEFIDWNVRGKHALCNLRKRDEEREREKE